MSSILIAEEGNVFFPVWIHEESAQTVLYAAGELTKFLSEITGVAYPQLISRVAPERCIRVAVSPDESLGAEGFTLRSGERGIAIEGGLPRGVLYGVYSFLERLGCRWFSSKVSRIPRRSRLTAPALSLREVPALEYRETFYTDAADANWSVRNKNNGSFTRLDAPRGGKISYYPFVHTFEYLMPVDEFFDSHPEYYSLVNGQRLGEKNRTQLCLTNPDVKRICTERVMRFIDEHPEATIFSVSQNDWYNNCECEQCSAVDAAEGSPSGSLIAFVNHIASAVAERYPHVLIDTLAYQYTRRAPRNLRPLPNVCVRLCTIECCFAHPLRQCDTVCSFGDKPHGESFQQDLRDWAKVCDRLYIWDYIVNFDHYLMPFPNFYVLADNIRFFIENNVKGIFEEGAAPAYGGAEFAELRAYVVAKLLWNPYQQTDPLIDEFLAGYYGMAAPALRDYFDLIHEKAADNADRHFGIYDQPRIPYLTEDVVAQCEAHLERALMMADDDAVYRRVRVAQLPIRYWRIYTMALNNPERPHLSDEFFADLAEFGIAEIWEGRAFRQSIERMKEGVIWRFGQD